MNTNYRIQINPFNAHRPVTNSSEFVGREAEIVQACNCLINKNSLIVTGTRGIGKTSFCHQLMHFMEGEFNLLERYRIEHPKNIENAMKAIPIYHICSNKDTLETIIHDLHQQTANIKRLQDIFRNWGLKIDLKLVKVEGPQQIGLSEQDATRSIFLRLSELIKKGFSFTIVLDEIERLHNVDLTSFIKPLIDHPDLQSITLILVGIRNSIGQLINKHQSMRRLLQVLHLGTMSRDEIYEIFSRAEEKSKRVITKEAQDYIIQIGGCCPDVIQRVAYEAFSIDSDNKLGVDDVENAIKRIQHQMKNCSPISDQIENEIQEFIVEKLISTDGDRLDKNVLIDKSEFPDEEIENNLSRLIELGIVEQCNNCYLFCVPLYRDLLKENIKIECYHCSGRKNCWRGSDFASESCIDCLEHAGYSAKDFGKINVACRICQGRGYIYKFQSGNDNHKLIKMAHRDRTPHL